MHTSIVLSRDVTTSLVVWALCAACGHAASPAASPEQPLSPTVISDAPDTEVNQNSVLESGEWLQVVSQSGQHREQEPEIQFVRFEANQLVGVSGTGEIEAAAATIASESSRPPGAVRQMLVQLNGSEREHMTLTIRESSGDHEKVEFVVRELDPERSASLSDRVHTWVAEGAQLCADAERCCAEFAPNYNAETRDVAPNGGAACDAAAALGQPRSPNRCEQYLRDAQLALQLQAGSVPTPQSCSSNHLPTSP